MLRQVRLNGILDELNIVLDKLKSYVYSSYFTINLHGNDVSHRLAIAMYLPYGEL